MARLRQSLKASPERERYRESSFIEEADPSSVLRYYRF